MDIKQSSQSTPKLCASCNMFFGTAASQWLCSTCYKTLNKSPETNKTSQSESQMDSLKQFIRNSVDAREEQKDKERCFQCHRKVGLLGVECKCDYVFCNQHRLPEDHNWKLQLRKDNSRLSTGKIDRI